MVFWQISKQYFIKNVNNINHNNILNIPKFNNVDFCAYKIQYTEKYKHGNKEPNHVRDAFHFLTPLGLEKKCLKDKLI